MRHIPNQSIILEILRALHEHPGSQTAARIAYFINPTLYHDCHKQGLRGRTLERAERRWLDWKSDVRLHLKILREQDWITWTEMGSNFYCQYHYEL